MHFSRSTFAAALIASFVKADYVIDPDSVSASDRASWCQSELSTCPIICEQIDDGDTMVNECDPDTLTYGCICGNGQAPNVSEYTLTLPYFTCVEWGTQCVDACAGDNTCANSCREDHPCGAQDPKKPNTTSTSTSSASTASATSDSEDAVHTNVLGSDDGDSAAIQVGRSYGLVIVVGALFAGFAML